MGIEEETSKNPSTDAVHERWANSRPAWGDPEAYQRMLDDEQAAILADANRLPKKRIGESILSVLRHFRP